MKNPHLWPDSAAINAAGHLTLGGCDATQLAEEFGTPLYVFDEATLRGTMRAYRAAFAAAYPHESAIHYASKALLNTAVAQLVAQEGLGLDVVSGGELFVARRAGFPMERVHLHGNAKGRAELQRALDWGVGAIVVDNLDELAQLAQLSAGRPTPQPILLRLAPGIDAHTHAHIATGAADSKFGLPIAALDAAAALARGAPGLRLLGLHAHIGSQVFDWEALTRNVAVLIECAARLRGRWGLGVEEISPGGGLGVAYLPEDSSGDIGAYARALGAAVLRACEQHALPQPRLTVEPGRSIVARSGVALYRVVATKRNAEAEGVRREILHGSAEEAAHASALSPQSRQALVDAPTTSRTNLLPSSPVYLHIDGGMADNIRPALYAARYTALLANRAAEPPGAPVHVAGRYCESGDVLLRDAMLPPAASGDLLAVAVSGAYTLSMASNYNGAPRPAVLLVGEGQARLIQRRETEEELVARDVAL
jgi:diaminopimelate decarboxylase